MLSTLYIVIIVLAVIVLWAVLAFNVLVTKRNRVKEGWSDIEVQLKRRYDLIPNLVSSVKGYVAHEKGVLESVTEARTRALSAGDPDAKAKAENVLSGALKTLFAVSENYPVLKANENFLKLQDELSDTENKIQAARRFYNGQVRDINIAVEKFPNSIIAAVFSFKQEELFELEDEPEAREKVKVEF
jgi:LemA protein